MCVWLYDEDRGWESSQRRLSTTIQKEGDYTTAPPPPNDTMTPETKTCGGFQFLSSSSSFFCLALHPPFFGLVTLQTLSEAHLTTAYLYHGHSIFQAQHCKGPRRVYDIDCTASKRPSTAPLSIRFPATIFPFKLRIISL